MTIDEFGNMDLRIAKILGASRVEGSDKLLKLKISLGAEERQLVTGIGKAYEPESLVGSEIVVVANLDPRKFSIGEATLESQGMLLAASDGETPVLLRPDKEVKPGTRIK